MIGQLDIDGNIEEASPQEQPLDRQLALARANNTNLMEQANVMGVDLDQTIDAGVMLQIRFAALHQFVMGSAPAEVRCVFDLLVEQKTGEVLQQILDEAMRSQAAKLYRVRGGDAEGIIRPITN